MVSWLWWCPHLCSNSYDPSKVCGLEMSMPGYKVLLGSNFPNHSVVELALVGNGQPLAFLSCSGNLAANNCKDARIFHRSSWREMGLRTKWVEHEDRSENRQRWVCQGVFWLLKLLQKWYFKSVGCRSGREDWIEGGSSPFQLKFVPRAIRGDRIGRFSLQREECKSTDFDTAFQRQIVSLVPHHYKVIF